MREAHGINRDANFRDSYVKLEGAAFDDAAGLSIVVIEGIIVCVEYACRWG